MLVLPITGSKNDSLKYQSPSFALRLEQEQETETEEEEEEYFANDDTAILVQVRRWEKGEKSGGILGNVHTMSYIVV